MKNIIGKKMIPGVLAAFLCLTTYACTDDKDNGGDGNYPSTTAVRPHYYRSAVLRNPLNGWVMYAARNANARYWDSQYLVPDLGEEVKMIDYASAGYLRTSWRLLNPERGVYSWRDPSSQTGELIQGALDRGLPIAFRIVVDGADQGLNTPQFVFDDGAQYLGNTSYPDRKSPFPQDPVFQAHYETLIEELAKDFNDPDKCAFIDAYGLGKWGEAHGVTYYDPMSPMTEAELERTKEEVMVWITDLYSRHFTNVPLVINYHRTVGSPASDGALLPDTEKLLGIAINKGYSLRSDAFGMSDYYKDWEKSFAKTWNYQRPIIMEGGWITGGTHRYWTDPRGYREGHPGDVRQGEFDDSAEARVNMMDFRSGDDGMHWFTHAFPLVQRFISEGGYRLYPDQIYLPEDINSGEQVRINHRWRNMGWGYFPNNIPQWNYRYKVAFALLDSSDNPVKIFIDPDAEPSLWLKDQPATYDFITTVDVPAGTYKWAVAIVDTKKDNKPAINLAVNWDITSDGWVELLDVRVK